MSRLQVVSGKGGTGKTTVAAALALALATAGKRTLRRSVVGRDRNDPDRHIVIAFFDDYDSAMVNSNLPETADFGQKQTALLDGPPPSPSSP